MHVPTHKLTITLSRCNKGTGLGFTQGHKEARRDDDGVLFQCTLPGADDPTIYNYRVVEEDVAPSVQVFRMRVVKNGAAVGVANDILVVVR